MNKRQVRECNEFENKKQILIGLKINRLTITEIFRTIKTRSIMCLAICECGKIKEYQLNSVRNGHSKSCGCYRHERWIALNTTHGLSGHPLCIIWTNIKARCLNPQNPNFKLYGGKGICICIEWANDFECFYTWCMGNGWESGLEIDRFPNKHGDYCPENCRIVTHKINMNNTTRNVILNIDGETMTRAEASEKYNIDYVVLEGRMRNGWTDSDSVKIPVRTRRSPKLH